MKIYVTLKNGRTYSFSDLYEVHKFMQIRGVEDYEVRQNGNGRFYYEH